MTRDYYKVLLVGQSGRGKTFSFRNMNPDTTGFINVEDKPLPFKNKLLPNYRKVFNFFESIFEPIINFLRNVIKPVKVGLGLSVDMSQVILLVILLIILNFY